MVLVLDIFLYLSSEFLVVFPTMVHKMSRESNIFSFISFTWCNIVGGIDRETGEAQYLKRMFCSVFLGNGGHDHWRYGLVYRSVLAFEMMCAVIIRHFLAIFIAFFCHEECGLQRERCVLMVNLLVESGKAVLRYQFLETPIEQNVAVHVDSALGIYCIEAHRIGSGVSKPRL